MKWLKLSNRYLNLAHVASVYAFDDGACDVGVANGQTFELKGADADTLLIALEELTHEDR